MLRWLARLLLFRILPRRVVPLLALVEVAQLLRAARNQRRPAASERGATVGR